MVAWQEGQCSRCLYGFVFTLFYLLVRNLCSQNGGFHGNLLGCNWQEKEKDDLFLVPCCDYFKRGMDAEDP